MNIKIIIANITNFTVKRLIELTSICLIILSILLLLSLITYSPEDPNFIFQNSKEIKNIFGAKGSYVSDFLFQSFGIISFLIPLTLLFSGVRMFVSKNLTILISNLFYTILYIFFGSLFYSLFYEDSYLLLVNGNGGFVGEFVKEHLFFNYLNEFKGILFYFLIVIVLFLFLISANLDFDKIRKIFKLFIDLKKRPNNNLKEFDNSEKETLGKKINDEDIVQGDLPFNNVSTTPKLKFKLPKFDILDDPKRGNINLKKQGDIKDDFLEKILLDFGVEGKIKKVNYGPVVTLYEFEPAAGVKVSKIINLSEDIARNTKSESARISVIPGSNTIGIELPNNERENVYLKEIISNSYFNKKDYKLPIALGKSISGLPIVGDLSSMPHLLIAGTTGSGKSVCINTIILSLIYKHSPDKCKFILIDPKMLELSTYEGIPHLLCPVITEPKKATSVLGWVVKEMENRYKLMTKESVRNIDSYNSKHKSPMPYIVVIVDEMSDLMHVAGKEIETYIQKLSQMARASGIHIIMATQRPSVDVITGTIKANFPTRISFQVSSKIDSRTILGEQGAEQLLGKGDMLYMSSANKIVRIHAPFVSDNEIEKVNNFLRSQADPEYFDEILNYNSREDNNTEEEGSEKDELYNSALEIIRLEGKASTSFLQRKLQIGYNRAARIIDMMEERGIVSKANHSGKRELLK